MYAIGLAGRPLGQGTEHHGGHTVPPALLPSFSNVTYDRTKRLPASFPRGVPRRDEGRRSGRGLPPDHGQHPVELVGLDQDVTRLGTLARAHDVA
ncbi:hypothetical protein GCM10010327_24870 [Streptomyces nitrosporeus]|nr:hypothetical protein GCM10010327_24870 [Streptomyces nitrosporeus]